MLFLPALLLVAAPPGPDLTPRGLVYTVDTAHSVLDFTVRLVGFNRVRGSFKDYSADMNQIFADSSLRPTSPNCWAGWAK